MRRVTHTAVVLALILAATSLCSAAPIISSISPTSGPRGASVTIAGSGFGATKGSSSVRFSGLTAQTTSWSNTSIVAMVPSNVLNGSVDVIVRVGGVNSNTAVFTVIGPIINGLSTNSAPENSVITIDGSGFGATQDPNSTVTFNGTLGIPSSWSDTAITVPVPAGATTGNIIVSVNGIAGPGYAFMVVPAPQPPGAHFIQGNYAMAGSVPSAITVPFPIPQTAGNLNVVVVGWLGSYTVTSVVDTANNTYVLAAGPTLGTTRRQTIYYAKNISAATSNVITVNFAQQGEGVAPPLAVDIRIAEYSGLDTSSPLDVAASATASSATADSGFATTTNGNDLLVGAGVADGRISGAGPNYTTRVIPANIGSNSDILEDRIVTATGSYKATAPLQASSQWVMQMLAFKEAPNQAPTVDAGPNQTINLPTNAVTLHGTATDDGLPNNTLTISWTKVSGPGTVSFNTPDQATTDATFSAAGTYVLRLTAGDSQLTTSATTTITVNPANQAPVVSAGTNQTITLPANVVVLSGSATDDGLPIGSVLTVNWSVVSGPSTLAFANSNAASTTAMVTAAGIYVLHLTASDSALSSSADVTITVNPAPGTPASASIVLSPASTGPIQVGTAQQMQATVRDGSGSPIPNASVTFTVNGPNGNTGNSTTNASGVATFSYTGSHVGVDSIVATATLGMLNLTSNTSMVSWTVSGPSVTLSTVTGQFFPSDGSGTFNTVPTAQPAFTQTFPTVNFNPPAGSIPGMPSSIDVTTLPFTEVTTDASGNYTGSVIAAGNGLQAGTGQLSTFQAVFTGTFAVAAAGNVTFNFLNSDGFIFGVGNGATRVSGTWVEPPTTGVTPFHSYPVMGSFNTVTSPVANTVTVHFPAAGSYSYEVDYADSNQVALIPPGDSWKYSLVNPNGFQLVGFDDSTFAIGQTPFTNVVGGIGTQNCPLIGKTLFPPLGTLDVRKLVSLPAGATNIKAFVAIDNDFTLWVNGTQVINQPHEFCASEWNYTVSIPDSLWVPGTNLIAVQARDRGLDTGLEFELTGPSTLVPAKPLTLVMSTNASNTQSSLTVSPRANFSNILGQPATFTALVTDPAGAPMTNVPVTFNVAGANLQQAQVFTSTSGLAIFTYEGFFAGADIVQAQAQVGATALVSNQTQVTWDYLRNPPANGTLVLAPTNPTPLTVGQTQNFTVRALSGSGVPVPNVPVTLLISIANTQQLTATTDATGTASFSYSGAVAGTDTIEANANINGTAAFSNLITMHWNPLSGVITYIFTPQGWIGSPTIGTVVQGQVPITLAQGITLTSGTLQYFPSSDPTNVTVLNANTTGTGPLTLGTFDATVLANGEYTVQLQSISSTGAAQLNEIVLSVTGESKPGEQKIEVTDLKIPLAGIPINITRTYDSLNRGKMEDFGFGWKLETNIELEVDRLMNVTFTLNGKRQTFYFTPKSAGQSLFPWMLAPKYTPQPGLYGSLTSNGCGILIYSGGTLVQDQSGVVCFPGGTYQPTIYTYTDAAGRVYTMTSSGQLQTIKDLNGNTLTFTSTGITSSVGGAAVTFVRDSQGRITQITDLNQNNYVYTYDTCGTGELCTVTYPGVNTIQVRYTYASDHSLLTQTDPNNNTITTTYYPNGRLQSVTSPFVPGPNGSPVQYVTSYTYDVTTNTTTTTNPDGGIVSQTNNSFGQPLSITQAVTPTTNRTTTFTYDTKRNLISQSDGLGNTTKYTYDANGFQTSVQLPGLPANSVTYNQVGGITSQIDAAGTNTIITTYDANFNPQQTTDSLHGPNTFVASYTFDGMGNLKTYTDANHKTTTFNYFPTGYLQDKTDALQEKTSYTYDAMGSVATMTDPRGKLTQYFYDPLERLAKIIDANNITTQFLNDLNGNKTDEIDAVGTTLQRTTHYDYDALNRVSTITYPDSTTKQFTYDFRGNKLTETDQLGHVTKYAYDFAGQLTGVTYAYGTADAGTVSYTYDGAGRQQTITDESNQGTNHQNVKSYDAAGRLTSVQDAVTNVTQYSYDADNRRTSMTDANHNTTQYSYDARGRLSVITYPATATQGATTTQHAYDGMGRVLTTTDQAGNITTKIYDDVGRLSSVTDAVLPTGNITIYTYDLNGNLQTIQDANQHSTSFQYDNLNRRSQRTLPLQQSETYQYDALGRLQYKTDFNGKTTTHNYDSLDRLLSKVPDPTLNQPTISFTYTATGRRQTMTDASGTTNYSLYDNRDRLRTKTTPEGALSYTYDAHGNVLTLASSNANGPSMTYTYDPLNRLTTVTDNRLASQGVASPVTTYSYDPVGNMSGYSYSANGLQSTYQYDSLNRLSQVGWSKGSSALSSFAYTPFPAGMTKLYSLAMEAAQTWANMSAIMKSYASLPNLKDDVFYQQIRKLTGPFQMGFIECPNGIPKSEWYGSDCVSAGKSFPAEPVPMAAMMQFFTIVPYIKKEPSIRTFVRGIDGRGVAFNYLDQETVHFQEFKDAVFMGTNQVIQ